jgi:filamentous hemagglutinin
MPSGTLIAYNQGGSASGTTSSAVSNGTLDIRDPAKQQQNVATLSHDVEHANDSISPIFDKEKEQKRLQQVKLISEIGTQVSDIVRTQGELNAEKVARKELASQGNEKPTQEQIRAAKSYKEAMEPYGTGGDYQRATQAVTAALQGLAGGDIGSALAGASAPYLANFIKQQTEDNDTARIMAQAVLGAVVAKTQGNSAAAGAAGAATGELIAAQLYPSIKREDLSEAQKQTISALSTLAAGFIGGAVGGDLAGAAAGAQSGKNATENNELGSRLLAEKRYRDYAEQSCGGVAAEVCRSNYSQKIMNESGPVVAVLAGTGVAAGVVLLGPELMLACGMNPTICTELGIAAVELPFGAATTGGTALGMGGFGSAAAKEVAAAADATGAVQGAKATATPRTPLAGPTENWKTFVNAEKQIQLEAGAGQRVDQVINETLSGKKNFTSSMTLTTDEALSAGQKYLGPEYREIGKPGSGVFHSADGTKEFRIDSGSISGAHAPGVPHVHFGVKDPVTGKYISNNHVPYAD